MPDRWPAAGAEPGGGIPDRVAWDAGERLVEQVSPQQRQIRFTLLQGGTREPRLGCLQIGELQVPTPAFMPVGTRATVKTLDAQDVEEIGSRLILANTYHLHLRPGAALIRGRGGLHRFMGWRGGILTDSGGFQVHSLARLCRIQADGVEFRSHLDGSSHFFTPARVLEIQQDLGSDIRMVLDVCTPYPAEESRVVSEMETTLRWAEQAIEQRARMRAAGAWHGALFGIVQGGVHEALRARCARELALLPFEGYALGGFSVGEPLNANGPAMDAALAQLPPERPRYLMGVGSPVEMIDAIARGVDLFDCVLPTRNARKGTVFTREGKLVVKNAVYAEDDRPIDEQCSCRACQRYSRAYIRHLFQVGEQLAGRLATIHSLAFMEDLMRRAREAIAQGAFSTWAEEIRRRHGR